MDDDSCQYWITIQRSRKAAAEVIIESRLWSHLKGFVTRRLSGREHLQITPDAVEDELVLLILTGRLFRVMDPGDQDRLKEGQVFERLKFLAMYCLDRLGAREGRRRSKEGDDAKTCAWIRPRSLTGDPVADHRNPGPDREPLCKQCAQTVVVSLRQLAEKNQWDLPVIRLWFQVVTARSEPGNRTHTTKDPSKPRWVSRYYKALRDRQALPHCTLANARDIGETIRRALAEFLDRLRDEHDLYQHERRLILDTTIANL